MKKALFIVLAFYAQSGVAANTVFYDIINGKELIFTATSRYEYLAIDELNPVEEVGYSFFTFLNENYEEQRIEKIYKRFKRRPLEASFKQVADSLGQVYFKNSVSENSNYYDLEYEGYVVEDIYLRPISYLGNTLTFSFSAKLKINELHERKFTAEEIYFLNLDDFTILLARAIHASVDHRALRQALVKKWREIQSEMPDKGWAPIRAKAKEVDIYMEDYGYEDEKPEPEPAVHFSDSLISYALHSADLRKAEIIYTGAGVLVVLHDAIPWFETRYGPLGVQLHLNAYEAKEALRNFEPYAAIQNAVEPKPGKLPVDPYDLFHEVRFLALTSHYINYLRLEDSSVYAIERYYKNHPEDSQYVHRINYANGRAMHIKGQSNRDTSSYDSIFWHNNKVKAVISKKQDRNYDEESGYLPGRHLQLQVRDENGNTKWQLSTERSFSMQHYCYFDGKVAKYPYPILIAGRPENHYDQKPYWFELVKTGLCEENGLCAKVDEKGRPVVSYNDYYAYDGDKLVQILGDRENSTLFYYDEKDRLSEILKTASSPQTTRLFYEGDSNLPYRVEHSRPNQSHPQNYYQVIHRR